MKTKKSKQMFVILFSNIVSQYVSARGYPTLKAAENNLTSSGYMKMVSKDNEWVYGNPSRTDQYTCLAARIWTIEI